jgi:hypothetical protein
MRRITVAVALPVVLLTPAGCSDANDAASGAKQAATGAASDAASQATEKAKDEAADKMTQEICKFVRGSGPLADGAADAKDKAAVGQLAAASEYSGVPDEFLKPLNAVASGGKGEAKDAITDLKKSCAA